MYKRTDFCDNRLCKTGNDLFNSLVKKQKVCLRGLGGTCAKEVKFGRFLRNEKANVQSLIKAETSRVAKLVPSRHILAVQDTSEINYQKHAGKVNGLGVVGNGVDAGLFLHPALIVDAEQQEGLGLGAIHTWNRTKKACKNYQAQPIEEKESYRWIEVADQVLPLFRSAARFYNVFIKNILNNKFNLFDILAIFHHFSYLEVYFQLFFCRRFQIQHFLC